MHSVACEACSAGTFSDALALATAAGFVLDGSSEVNANPRDTADHPFGVWTLPPNSRTADRDGNTPDSQTTAGDGSSKGGDEGVFATASKLVGVTSKASAHLSEEEYAAVWPEVWLLLRQAAARGQEEAQLCVLLLLCFDACACACVQLCTLL